MGKVKGKHRLDKFYHLAKEQGYRSRAAFKLIQLDSKYTFLHSSRAVLDLCAAPGGWMQVAVNRVPVGSLVIGVDLFPIRPIRGCISVEEDITKPKCRTTLKKLLSDNGSKAFDLVLHDGSPNVGGAWAQEATSQNALVVDSVKLATEFLAPKGTFVTKVFRSQDYNAVLYCLRQLFEKVEVTKPVASRSTSAEIYVIGLKYKAPAKIDPRLLDIKHLFQGVIEPPKARDIFEEGKAKRRREGYDDGLTLVRKVCPASEFVWESKDPVEMLGHVTSISFDDPSSLPIKDHPLTDEEIKILCEDLRVLGKQDFKQLLKWRINVQKALSSTGKPTSTSLDAVEVDEDVKANEDKEEDDQDEDEKVLDEMEKLTHDVERKKKREKKLLAKRRAKDKVRKATGMQIDALQDGYVDNELFSLSSIKGKEDLATVDATEDVEVGDLAGSDDDRHNEADEDSDSDVDSDEERSRYDEQIDKTLDEAYERYLAKTDGSTKQRKRAKEAYSDVLLPDGDGDKEVDELDYDSDKDQGDKEANPLVVPIDLDKELTQEEIMQRWYSQDIFAEAITEGDLGKKDGSDDEDDELPVHVRKPRVPLQNKANESSKLESLNKNTQNRSAKKMEDDLEVVPAPLTDSSDSSSDDESEEEYDTDTKCEILAVAKKMIRKRKREELLDDGYNKRTFDDRGSLPRWFEEDEQRHNQPLKPVTKEEIAAERARFKEINARPAKKVAEAKARKKRAAMRTMEKVRKKANSIADQSDIADRSKRRLIESLYSKAANPKKPKKEYVVAKKGVQVKAGKGKVIVDRRMKSDARQHGMNRDKKGKGKSKGKGKGTGKGKGRGEGMAKGKGREEGMAKRKGKGKGAGTASGRKGKR